MTDVREARNQVSNDQALRHSKVKLTWDQDDPSRNKLTRRTLTRQEIEEEDFKTYLASESDGSGSDAEVPQSFKQPGESAKARTARLRALLLGNGEDGAEDVWGKQGRTAATALEASNSRSSEGMEITFKPGLTAAAAAADDEELTTLQKYQRRMKEKLQRKKEKRELRNSGTKATGDGADKPDVIADDFFGADEAEEPLREKKKASKPVIANTETLSDAIDGDPSRHFSMTDVVKEERQAGKKRRRGKHGKKTDVGDERERELGDDQWQIDVKDERFRALHEEAEFAIDPSNPKCVSGNLGLAANQQISKDQGHGETAGREVCTSQPDCRPACRAAQQAQGRQAGYGEGPFGIGEVCQEKARQTIMGTIECIPSRVRLEHIYVSFSDVLLCGS